MLTERPSCDEIRLFLSGYQLQKNEILFPGDSLELLDIFAVIRILITISIYLHYTDHLK